MIWLVITNNWDANVVAESMYGGMSIDADCLSSHNLVHVSLPQGSSDDSSAFSPVSLSL